MPTILDTLTLKLGLDPTEFERGVRAVVEKTKTASDDHERYAKGFQAVIGGLVRALAPIATALIGIGSAIEAIDWTRHASAATTQFGNLAEVIGMSAEQLSAWKQAASAAAGSGDELAGAFASIQESLQQMGPGGTGAVNQPLLQTLQHYGIDPSRYYDAQRKVYDVDAIAKAVAAASTRMGESPAQRNPWLSNLGISNPGNQSLFQSREFMEEALRKQREIGVVTKENVSAAKRLQEDFANVASAAGNLGLEIVTRLVEPLSKGLQDLQRILTELRGWTVPEWITRGVEGGWLPPSWDMRARPPSGQPGVSGVPGSNFGPGSGLTVPGSPNYVPPATSVPSVPSAPAVPVAPSAPAAPRPAIPFSGAPYTGGPMEAPISTPLPMVPGPRSSIDSGILALPQFAAASSLEGRRASVTTTNQSSVTIGAMTFNSRTSDTELGHAPSGSERTLSVGQYAIHPNDALV